MTGISAIKRLHASRFVAIFYTVRIKYECLIEFIIYAPNRRVISVLIFYEIQIRWPPPFLTEVYFFPRIHDDVVLLYTVMFPRTITVHSRPANAFRSTDYVMILNLQNKTHFVTVLEDNGARMFVQCTSYPLFVYTLRVSWGRRPDERLVAKIVIAIKHLEITTYILRF